MVTFYIYELDEPNKVGITSEEKEDLKLLQQLNFPDTKFANAYFKCAFGESTENNGMKVFKLEIPIKLEIMDNYHLWAGLIDNVREICAHYHKYRDNTKDEILFDTYLKDTDVTFEEFLFCCNHYNPYLSEIYSDRLVEFIHELLPRKLEINQRDVLWSLCLSIQKIQKLLNLEYISITHVYCKYIIKYHDVHPKYIMYGTLINCIRCANMAGKYQLPMIPPMIPPMISPMVPHMVPPMIPPMPMVPPMVPPASYPVPVPVPYPMPTTTPMQYQMPPTLTVGAPTSQMPSTATTPMQYQMPSVTSFTTGSQMPSTLTVGAPTSQMPSTTAAPMQSQMPSATSFTTVSHVPPTLTVGDPLSSTVPESQMSSTLTVGDPINGQMSSTVTVGDPINAQMSSTVTSDTPTNTQEPSLNKNDSCCCNVKNKSCCCNNNNTKCNQYPYPYHIHLFEI